MKNGKPETLEEALKIIEMQNRRLSENKIEIALLKEHLALKRAREFLARSEKSSKILKEQPYLPFDIEFTKEVESQDITTEEDFTTEIIKNYLL